MRILIAALLFIALFSGVFAEIRPEARLGLRGSYSFPPANEPGLKKAIAGVVLELDFKRNKEIDNGLRLGYASFNVEAADLNAAYHLFQAGYGCRFYMDIWRPAYLLLEGSFYLAAKSSEITKNAPSAFVGYGLKTGVGAEYKFDPQWSGFAEGSYLMTYLNTSGGTRVLPIGGAVIDCGIRMAR